MAIGLGPMKAALPMFHALTGCDILSSLVGNSKSKAWFVWNAFSELTNVLRKLSSAPSAIKEDIFYHY